MNIIHNGFLHAFTYTHFKDILRYIRVLVKILGHRVRIIIINNLWAITSTLALYHCQFLIKIASFLFPHIQVHQKWTEEAGGKRGFLTGLSHCLADFCLAQLWEALSLLSSLLGWPWVSFPAHPSPSTLQMILINSRHDTLHSISVCREYDLKTSATRPNTGLGPGLVGGVKCN